MQAQKTQRKRGRPRKHFSLKHLHIILDESTYQKLDDFCNHNFISKQDLIHNLILDFLEDNNKTLRFTTSKRKDYYTEFVRHVLRETINQITKKKTIYIRITYDTLLEFLGLVGLVPHRSTLQRYIKKMEAEMICRHNPAAKDIRVIAGPLIFQKYLPELYPHYQDILDVWYQELCKQKIV